VRSLDISPDGQRVVSSDSSGMSAIDANLGRVQGYWMTGPKLHSEEFGKAPVAERPDWADGVLKVVNLESRVYSQWANGKESYFYRGKGQALNEALRQYATV